MGNCLVRSRGGNDGAGHRDRKRAAALALEEEEERHVSREKAPARVTEVKIRITRKQLEDLLRRLDRKDGGGGAVMSEILCMTSGSDFRHRGQTVPWRPALQSIPE